MTRRRRRETRGGLAQHDCRSSHQFKLLSQPVSQSVCKTKNRIGRAFEELKQLSRDLSSLRKYILIQIERKSNQLEVVLFCVWSTKLKSPSLLSVLTPRLVFNNLLLVVGV